jgi:16S rRNA (cytosine967-C5)-methyltransferase
LWPHIHGTDGFFGAVFQKKALPQGQSPEKGEGKETQVKTKKPAKELK